MLSCWTLSVFGDSSAGGGSSDANNGINSLELCLQVRPLESPNKCWVTSMRGLRSAQTARAQRLCRRGVETL